MRTETLTRTLYQFDELSDKAKETARQWWRDLEAQDSDASYTIDDSAEIATLLGITLEGRRGSPHPAIYWSGFYNQGDGACFEGTYRYAKGAAKAARALAPKDATLHRIADELQAAQQTAFYQLAAVCQHSGHYSHSGCMSVEVERDSPAYQYATKEQDSAVRDALRSFADWIYRQLESEYEYRMSDENVDESIRANEYEFNQDGTHA